MRLRGVAIAGGALAIAAAALAPMAIKATNATGATSKSRIRAADFAGTWQLNPEKSDQPGAGMRGGMRGGGMRGGMGGGGGRGMGGGGRHRGGGGGGMRGGRPEGGPPPEGAPGGGRRMLPPYLSILSSDQGLALSDSSGTIVQEIVFGAAPADGQDKEPPQLHGVWKGDQLVVTRSSERGTMTETFAFDAKNSRLEVHTKMERAGGEGGGFEMKRVYNRVRSS